MAADLNKAAFHRYQQLQQQGPEMVSMLNYYASAGGILNNCTAGVVGENLIFPPNYSGGPNVDSDYVPGLKHNTGFSVEWSTEDQHIMEEGLVKYANEPAIMRYVKIAASLHDKTVRDVALRWRWMARKRKKQEDQAMEIKVKNWKEILVDSSLKKNISTASSMNNDAVSVSPSCYGHSMLSGVLSSTFRHLLEENHRVFSQISSNILTHELQENIVLFLHARNNIVTILNDMRNMPGIISRMPPLPIFINEELASRIFPRISQVLH